MDSKVDIHLKQTNCVIAILDNFVQSRGDWTSQLIEVETPVAEETQIKPLKH